MSATEVMPRFIEPMRALPAPLPADQSGWAFEVKWDGVRAIARVEPGELRLFSRNANEITVAYPELRALAESLRGRTAILDGEIVCFDARGRPSFEALQRRMHLRDARAIAGLSRELPVTYLLFDLLWLDGQSLLELPYRERRERLEALACHGPRCLLSEAHVGQGDALFAATREQGLEGVIGKRLDAPYRPGARSRAWIKLKHIRRQEFVIGGWTPGAGARAHTLGALQLGVHDAGGLLRHAGGVGTGFDGPELRRLLELLRPLERGWSPFAGRQPEVATRFVEPVLVCECEFSEWTRSGTLRQASYKGLRDDKPAAEVVREEPVGERALGYGRVGDGRERERPVGDGRVGDARARPPASLSASARRVSGGVQVEVEGRTLRLTNLDKILYPSTGFTKSDLIDYYARVAPVLLPHLRDRPLTLKRYPDGVSGGFFYEKRSPSHRPEWVATARVAEHGGRAAIDYTLCQDLPTLIWLANLADIELHPLLSRVADHAHGAPTAIVFDLDPGAGMDIVACCTVALELRGLFTQLGLSAYPKTSGSKGLQVYVPLNSGVGYERTKPFAQAVARLLQERRPELVVSTQAKARRAGRVLIDWSQNDAHKTTVSVYSLRATERPGVSTPLAWDEVVGCEQRGDAALLAPDPEAVLKRIMQSGDLFFDVLSLEQTLPEL